MKILSIIVVCFLLFGWLVIAALVAFIQSLREKKREKKPNNKFNNYGYPYYGFNNPFMDGFE